MEDLINQYRADFYKSCTCPNRNSTSKPSTPLLSPKTEISNKVDVLPHSPTLSGETDHSCNDSHCDYDTEQFTKPIDLDKEIEVILDIKIEHRCKVVENFLCLIKK